ncbi:uncharacterized protein LOC143293488 isoform X2 [Babylonia areolata]|uniref:uncharacterized protein LOC143293488 isoform X2 n=1 Tax=Babylonia areolata TaxID=304850 RepID=UPI003FD50DA3
MSEFQFREDPYNNIPADDFAPRRPLPEGRLYHFNVIYNHARCPRAATADNVRALQWTRKAVEQLQLEGLVNSYYHDRDCPPGVSFREELDRVITGSEVTVVLLTPGFIRDCWPRYWLLSPFRALFTSSADGDTSAKRTVATHSASTSSSGYHPSSAAGGAAEFSAYSPPDSGLVGVSGNSASFGSEDGDWCGETAEDFSTSIFASAYFPAGYSEDSASSASSIFAVPDSIYTSGPAVRHSSSGKSSRCSPFPTSARTASADPKAPGGPCLRTCSLNKFGDGPNRVGSVVVVALGVEKGGLPAEVGGREVLFLADDCRRDVTGWYRLRALLLAAQPPVSGDGGGVCRSALCGTVLGGGEPRHLSVPTSGHSPRLPTSSCTAEVLESTRKKEDTSRVKSHSTRSRSHPLYGGREFSNITGVSLPSSTRHSMSTSTQRHVSHGDASDLPGSASRRIHGTGAKRHLSLLSPVSSTFVSSSPVSPPKRHHWTPAERDESMVQHSANGATKAHEQHVRDKDKREDDACAVTRSDLALPHLPAPSTRQPCDHQRADRTIDMNTGYNPQRNFGSAEHLYDIQEIPSKLPKDEAEVSGVIDHGQSSQLTPTADRVKKDDSINEPVNSNERIKRTEEVPERPLHEDTRSDVLGLLEQAGRRDVQGDDSQTSAIPEKSTASAIHTSVSRRQEENQAGPATEGPVTGQGYLLHGVDETSPLTPATQVPKEPSSRDSSQGESNTNVAIKISSAHERPDFLEEVNFTNVMKSSEENPAPSVQPSRTHMQDSDGHIPVSASPTVSSSVLTGDVDVDCESSRQQRKTQSADLTNQHDQTFDAETADGTVKEKDRDMKRRHRGTDNDSAGSLRHSSELGEGFAHRDEVDAHVTPDVSLVPGDKVSPVVGNMTNSACLNDNMTTDSCVADHVTNVTSVSDSVFSGQQTPPPSDGKPPLATQSVKDRSLTNTNIEPRSDSDDTALEATEEKSEDITDGIQPRACVQETILTAQTKKPLFTGCVSGSHLDPHQETSESHFSNLPPENRSCSKKSEEFISTDDDQMADRSSSYRAVSEADLLTSPAAPVTVSSHKIPLTDNQVQMVFCSDFVSGTSTQSLGCLTDTRSSESETKMHVSGKELDTRLPEHQAESQPPKKESENHTEQSSRQPVNINTEKQLSENNSDIESPENQHGPQISEYQTNIHQRCYMLDSKMEKESPEKETKKQSREHQMETDPNLIDKETQAWQQFQIQSDTLLKETQSNILPNQNENDMQPHEVQSEILPDEPQLPVNEGDVQSHISPVPVHPQGIHDETLSHRDDIERTPHGNPEEILPHTNSFEIIRNNAQILPHGNSAQTLSVSNLQETLPHEDLEEKLPHVDPEDKLPREDPEHNLPCEDPEDNLPCEDPEDSLPCEDPEDSLPCEDPEDELPREDPEDKLPREDPEDNLPREDPEDNLPCEDPEDSLPCEDPEDNLPLEDPEDNLPHEDPEDNLPREDPEGNLPREDPEDYLPHEDPEDNLPREDPEDNLPHEDPEDSLPPEDPEDNLPREDPEDSLPREDPEDNLPHEDPEDSLPREDPEDNLPCEDPEDSLPRLDLENHLPHFDLEDKLPHVDLENNLPCVHLEDNLPHVDLEDNLPHIDFKDNLPRINFEDTPSHRHPSETLPQEETKQSEDQNGTKQYENQTETQMSGKQTEMHTSETHTVRKVCENQVEVRSLGNDDGMHTIQIQTGDWSLVTQTDIQMSESQAETQMSQSQNGKERRCEDQIETLVAENQTGTQALENQNERRMREGLTETGMSENETEIQMSESENEIQMSESQNELNLAMNRVEAQPSEHKRETLFPECEIELPARNQRNMLSSENLKATSPENQKIVLPPGHETKMLSSEIQTENLSPENQTEMISPENQTNTLTPENETETLLPENETEMSHENQTELLSPENQMSTLSCDNQTDTLSPKNHTGTLSHENETWALSPENETENETETLFPENHEQTSCPKHQTDSQTVEHQTGTEVQTTAESNNADQPSDIWSKEKDETSLSESMSVSIATPLHSTESKTNDHTSPRRQKSDEQVLLTGEENEDSLPQVTITTVFCGKNSETMHISGTRHDNDSDETEQGLADSTTSKTKLKEGNEDFHRKVSFTEDTEQRVADSTAAQTDMKERSNDLHPLVCCAEDDPSLTDYLSSSLDEGTLSPGAAGNDSGFLSGGLFSFGDTSPRVSTPRTRPQDGGSQPVDDQITRHHVPVSQMQGHTEEVGFVESQDSSRVMSVDAALELERDVDVDFVMTNSSHPRNGEGMERLSNTSFGSQTEELPSTSFGSQTEELPSTSFGSQTEGLPSTSFGSQTEGLPSTSLGSQTETLHSTSLASQAGGLACGAPDHPLLDQPSADSSQLAPSEQTRPASSRRAVHFRTDDVSVSSPPAVLGVSTPGLQGRTEAGEGEEDSEVTGEGARAAGSSQAEGAAAALGQPSHLSPAEEEETGATEGGESGVQSTMLPALVRMLCHAITRPENPYF